MSFRKRDVSLPFKANEVSKPKPKWIRPSTLLPTYPTVSTGTSSLDKLLLHGGQPLGTSLLVIEDSATDFASVIARCYAAQGVANQNIVVTVGAGPRWGLDLPAPTELKPKSAPVPVQKEELKIAWRYRQSGSSTDGQPTSTADNLDSVYCRTYNITTRQLPPPKLHQIDSTSFADIVSQLSSLLASHAPDTVIRAVFPNFLSPTVYDPATSFEPQVLLDFLFSVRTLLRLYPSRLTVLLTLSRSLFDRSSSGNSILLPWIEILLDGIIKLIPDTANSDTKTESRIQGFVDVIKIPIVSDRGGMMVRKMDYAFKVGKNGLKIEEWSIPVMIDEQKDKKQDKLEY
ncbi:Elongator complex protein 4 [Lipomyces arxii]|uniref:Elongator complex protein 4 n=1 Tax=Lipomyces arxii TaxID=56418 RepID=UPI0034CE00CB